MIDSQVLPASIMQASQTGDCFKAALIYQQLSLSVLPLNGKRPALSAWSGYQFAPAIPDAIHSWEQNGLFGNVGIVCGKVSDNLVVVDFDGAGGYPAFAAMFPNLVDTFTVATGGGIGRHVYLRVDRLPTTTRGMNTPIGHIELRSGGAYVVAPPSIHPDTQKPYVVEKPLDILRVANLDDVAAWIKGFASASVPVREWKPPQTSSPFEGEINLRVIEAISMTLEGRGYKPQREWLNGPCIFPERHKHGDRHPSFGFNTDSAYGFCYVCGSIRAKDVCERLSLDPRDFGGLIKAPEPVVPLQPRAVPAVVPTKPAPPIPPPPEDKLPKLSEIELPRWLREYVSWASSVGNQTPETFHLGMGIWIAAVAIARRVTAATRWGIDLYPNLYMMFIADTTFYRKTTAYKLGERVLTEAIPHMLMPTPGSPERFQDAMAGNAPSNFAQLPQEHQKIVLEAQRFAAQRGLFKDEIAGLFGSFKRDYMAGLKDFLLEVYDCPDFMSKETQSGLAIVKSAAPSILGVTTPAGLSSSVSVADWDNGLLPRFALLTPEADYSERPATETNGTPSKTIVNGLKRLHDSLPMPEKSGDGWKQARSLSMKITAWQECQDYSNLLRQQCDPRQETPLDDRLKGVYGRMHVQAMKVAMICAALNWADGDRKDNPTVTQNDWETGRAIAEHWRISAHRLLEHLDRSGSARQEFRIQDKLIQGVRAAGAAGVTLHALYKNHNLQAGVARQVAKDLVQAGQIVETRIGRAEAYLAAEFVGGGE